MDKETSEFVDGEPTTKRESRKGVKITYIHSTCGQPMVFTFNEERKGKKKSDMFINIPKKDRNGKDLTIAIGGGAYVLNREAGRTRKVVITPVTDEELALLHTSTAYMNMKKRGFFTEHAVNHIEADASGNPMDMEIKDNTSQISDHDHAHGKDERLSHASTRATAGINNTLGGEQPDSADWDSYGQIKI